jgi:hypothetical protein
MENWYPVAVFNLSNVQQENAVTSSIFHRLQGCPRRNSHFKHLPYSYCFLLLTISNSALTNHITFVHDDVTDLDIKNPFTSFKQAWYFDCVNTYHLMID